MATEMRDFMIEIVEHMKAETAAGEKNRRERVNPNPE